MTRLFGQTGHMPACAFNSSYHSQTGQGQAENSHMKDSERKGSFLPRVSPEMYFKNRASCHVWYLFGGRRANGVLAVALVAAHGSWEHTEQDSSTGRAAKAEKVLHTSPENPAEDPAQPVAAVTESVDSPVVSSLRTGEHGRVSLSELTHLDTSWEGSALDT